MFSVKKSGRKRGRGTWVGSLQAPYLGWGWGLGGTGWRVKGDRGIRIASPPNVVVISSTPLNNPIRLYAHLNVTAYEAMRPPTTSSHSFFCSSAGLAPFPSTENFHTWGKPALPPALPPPSPPLLLPLNASEPGDQASGHTWPQAEESDSAPPPCGQVRHELREIGAGPGWWSGDWGAEQQGALPFPTGTWVGGGQRFLFP